MPFLRLNNKKITKSTAHSLRAYLEAHQGSHIHNSALRLVKGASFIPSRERGSMTLEASFGTAVFSLRGA